MAPPSNTNKIYYDSLSSFELGVNSGISPTLLPKNQLAWAINATMRGGHAACRPPFEKQTFDFDDDEDLQDLVEDGYFQGAAVYRPDFGASQIIAQINGHIIRFTPVGEDWLVEDISIAGDTNVIGTTPVWMWQSEKWLIIQDGTGALPIFYDGDTCRRSYGPAETLGEVAAGVPANFPDPRVIGEVIRLTMTADWEHPAGTPGPFNVPVIYNGEFYQPIENNTLVYDVVLTPLYATVGENIVAGSNIQIIPSRIGVIATNGIINNGLPVPYPNLGLPLQFPSSITNFIGKQFVITGRSETFTAYTDNGLGGGYYNMMAYVGFDVSLLGQIIAAGSIATQVAPTDPNVVVGTTTADFVNPALGAEVVVTLTAPYSGPDGQVVWIGDRQYTIRKPDAPAASTTLYLVNLTDTTDAGVAVPTGAADGLITSVPEISAGRMGAYGMGRNWYSLTDGISYAAGDIVGGAAGTQANNYRDSVLKTTENDFLAGGGSFRLPSSGNTITSMTFTANLDTSLGQGPLQIGTDAGFFSNQSPVVRDTWEALENPIQTQSLIGQGPVAQNSTIAANSDVLFRSIEGLGSLIVARRNFEEQMSWGNTPISREVSRALENDNKSLFAYGSSVNFDNRWLTTCYPSVSGIGVFHQGLVALNFDLVSNLRGKAPPVYDGLWTGLNFVQALTGNFSGTGRAFAFAFNTVTSKLELYELIRTGDGYFDNGDTEIGWSIETPCMFREDIKPKSELIRLLDVELSVQDVRGSVTFEVQFKPDFYPCWTTWRSLQICADQSEDDSKPGYRTRLSLGDPPTEYCEEGNNRPLCIGHFFQFRINVTGYCKIMSLRAQATTQPEVDFAPPVCAPVTTTDLTTP